MKLFVGTAEIAEIGGLVAAGVADGVSKNQTLVANAGRPIR
ncbi:MAG TPA: hypothetical protein VK181_23450 [Rhizobium sp.]|nr:hypothetical protein [Rhizobium sp.]